MNLWYDSEMNAYEFRKRTQSKMGNGEDDEDIDTMTYVLKTWSTCLSFSGSMNNKFLVTASLWNVWVVSSEQLSEKHNV